MNDFFTQVSGNWGNAGLNRSGNASATVGANSTQGAPPAQVTLQRKGRRCWQWQSAVGGAGVAAWFLPWIDPQRNAASYPQGIEPYAVWELRALLCLDRTAQDINDTHDLGLGFSPGNNNQNMNNPAVGAVFRAGVQFGPAGAGKARLRSRVLQTGVGPPPYTCDFDTANTVVTNPANFDEREWHWYSLRIIGGGGGSAGVCKGLIDGVLFSQVAMDDTTAKFPTSNAGIGGAFGFHFGITNQTNGLVDSLYIAELDLIAGPTEADL